MTDKPVAFVRLEAVARGDRDEVTTRVRDAFQSASAWITDVHFFSGIQTVFAFEVSSENAMSLWSSLEAAGLSFAEATSDARLRATSAKGTVVGTLAVTFAKGDADLTHEVPAVPG